MNYQSQLKAILKASAWSQEELARRLGVSFATLNAWVNARSQPRAKALEAIKILHLDIVGVDTIDVGELAVAKDAALAMKTTLAAITKDTTTLDKLTLYLTYHTNTIEGSTMTLADTDAVLFKHKVLTNRTQVEQAEARNHRAALLWLLEQLENQDLVIDEQLVKGLHLRLMNGIMENAGQYRTHSVRILGTHVTVANYLQVPTLMSELFKEISTSSEDRIAILATTHAAFEKIHPFSDGNGRVGRLILLAQALQAELIPPLVLKERRAAYYRYLEAAQTRDIDLPLQLFIAESMATTNQLLFESE